MKAAPNISDNTGLNEDRKGTQRDGLRWKWRWLKQRSLSQAPPNDHRRLPCQVCYAEVKTALGTWEFSACHWGSDGYEARVELDSERLVSKRGFATRVEAQKHAEAMIFSFALRILKELE